MEFEKRIEGTFVSLWRLADDLNSKAQENIYELHSDDAGAYYIRFHKGRVEEHGSQAVHSFEIFNLGELAGYTTIRVKIPDGEPNYGLEAWKTVEGKIEARATDATPATKVQGATPNKAGRRPLEKYDQAREKLNSGIAPQEVWEWYCGQEKIQIGDSYAHEAFDAAMRRRKPTT